MPADFGMSWVMFVDFFQPDGRRCDCGVVSEQEEKNER